MKVYLYNTDDVEEKILEIRYALEILLFAVNGLKNYQLINNNELAGFESIILNARDKAITVIKELQVVNK